MESVDLIGREIGKFIKYWGFKEIHGRIWALLFLSKNPLTPEEIEQILKISRASISLAVNELLEYEVIIKVDRNQKNAQMYDCNPHIMEVISSVLRNRERKIIRGIKNSFKETKPTLEANQHFCTDRLNDLDNMINCALETLDQLTALKDISVDSFCQFEYLPRSPVNDSYTNSNQ